MVLNPRRQQRGEPRTINEQFFDALIRHQIGLLRLSGFIRNRIFRLLDRTETDIANQIRKRLARSQGLERPSDVRRLDQLLAAIRNTRLRAWREVTAEWVRQITEVATSEAVTISNTLKTVLPVTLETVIPAARQLRAIVTSLPFQGKVLREWARDIARADINRINDQIRIGLVQGESSQAIARRVVGTVALNGRDGVTEITRRQAEAITRTAVNHVSNQSRRSFFRANSDLFEEEFYVATLDARTTPICRSLDGKRFPVGRGPIPPLHFNCRSLRVAVISEEPIGNRPTRAFTERQLLREFADEQGIGRVTSRADLPRGTKGAFDTFARRRKRELTGTIPAKVSYQEWLGTQSRQFQDDVLGQTKGRLFRDGKLTLDKFVNRQGDELSLSELARREKEAFRAAGLDPDDFL